MICPRILRRLKNLHFKGFLEEALGAALGQRETSSLANSA